MNGDSVSDCEIGLTKENSGVDLYSSQDFHKNFQHIFKPHCMSQSHCFYTPQQGRNTFKQLYNSALKQTSNNEILKFKKLYDIS